MKSKKILTAVMCFCMSMQMCGYIQPSFHASADNTVVEQVVQTQNYDIYLYKNLGKYIEITAVSTMATGEITVPDEIDGLPVRVIGDHAFAGNANVTKITLPETVTDIGKQAFYMCTVLESVNIPSGVYRIQDETFLSCQSLKSVSLPDGVTSIGVRAFWGCKSLSSVRVPKTVRKIGEQAFQDCGISEINIPSGVTAIEANTFYGCSNLRTLTVPKSVATIGFNAFPAELQMLVITNPDCELHDFSIPSKDTLVIANANSKVCDFLSEHGYNVQVVGGVPHLEEYDLNGDNSFTIADVVALQEWILGKTELDYSLVMINADMNADGNIDVFDLCLMKQHYIQSCLLPPMTVENLTADIQSAEVEGMEADSEFISGQTKFALELLKNSVESDSENILISPYSVMQALAMTGNGADGETRTEMEQTLGGIAFDKLNKYLYTQRIGQPNTDNCKLVTANSIWTRNDDKRIQVKSDFLRQVVDYYGAEFYKAPFDQSTVSDINNWVDENTDHMINSVIDEIPAETVMYLINAVTFDAKWGIPYTEYDITDYDFKAYDGTIQNAEMMRSEEYFYLKDDNAVGFMKYYKDRRYAFAALLPNEDMTVSEYIDTLTPESLHNTLSNPNITPLDAGLPKFSYDYQKNLSDILSDMGMPTAFMPIADFSRLADTATTCLFIDYVLHKTHIEVNNEGTRAAAVTVVAANDCAVALPKEKPEVILDRPFLYCILDTETSLPVFIGTLNTLE